MSVDFICTGNPALEACVRIAPDDAMQAVASEFDQALLVARAEPVLTDLECWLGQPFDLQPIAMAKPTSRGSLPIEICIQRRSVDVPLVTLCLPVTAFTTLIPPPDELVEACDVYSLPVTMQLRVARVELAADQASLLVPGALLLLPESFTMPWQVSLLMPDGCLAAELDPRTSMIALDAPLAAFSGPAVDSGSGSDSGQVVDILSTTSIPVDPLPFLMPDRTELPLQKPLYASSFVATGAGKLPLNGQIAAVGSGFGFYADKAVGKHELRFGELA